jgi:hypothetical protein
MNAEQAWRLLTNNMPAAGQADLTVSGDDAVTAICSVPGPSSASPNGHNREARWYIKGRAQY